MAEGDLAQVRALNAAVREVEEALMPLMERKREDVVAELTPTARASLNVTMAFAASTLVHLLLKTRGVAVSQHAVKGELDRVKTYMKRVREAVAAHGDRGIFKPEPKPTLRVDKAASARMIGAALDGNNGDQPAAKRKPARLDEDDEDGAALGEGASDESDADADAPHHPVADYEASPSSASKKKKAKKTKKRRK